jgi:hypothetical protein
MAEQPRVVKTRITNVGGIDFLEIDHVSPVMLITGDNGVGKTSIGQSFDLIFDGGHRPDYIKQGAKKAEVVIELSDGTTIRRVQTLKTAEYTVTSRDGSVVKRPAEYVQGLVSGLKLNPMPLIDPANKKKRLQLLQEIMPINFSKAEIDKAFGCDSFLDAPEIGLEKFDALLQGQELARRDANVAVKEHESTLGQLKQQLPPQVDQDKNWTAEAERLQREREMLAARVSAMEKRGQLAIESRLEELRQEQDAKIEAIRKHYGSEMHKVRQEGATLIAAELVPLTEQREKLTAEISTALTRAQSQSQVQATQRMIETTDQKLAAAQRKANQHDRAVTGLRELRLKKLEQTPIPGLETRNGDLFYNGYNFDTQLNRAQQVMLVYRMAARSDRRMNFFVMDDAEHLSDGNREVFAEACKEAGFQLVMMAVEEGKPLTIEAA